MSPSIESEATWAVYCASRYVALSLPSPEIEQEAEKRAAAAMQCYLALGPESSSYYSRRCILFRRDHLLHDALALDIVPDRIPVLLNSVSDVGTNQLRNVEPGQGVLLVSLHYSLYSSMLIWWLARATVRGIFNSLTVFFRSNALGRYVLSEQRINEFENIGVWSRTRVTLLDGTAVGSPAAARMLSNQLSAGGAVLVFPDAWLLPDTDKSLTVCIGQQTLGLPRGVAWLLKASRCTIVPVHIRPHAEHSHAVVFGSPAYFNSNQDPSETAKATLQQLVDQTILVDPSPWEGWLREEVI